ncbi:helix-turn-helix domain-containing protein [Burkholderia sp. 22PA0106]|uniref:helix-turn-helix domain-containing protein n=1 Tax=Burkholderia sp. 22PA0106 TaxID=3237371 RepID=UPI0039C01F55
MDFIASAPKKRPPTALGDLLRHWRDVRGVSQLDLSYEAGVSQRQISFIESGRSVPGRQTLLDLAQTLDVPLRERNGLLLAAGYAPLFPETAWNAQEMQAVARAVDRMLRQHEPFPAIAMDRYWNVLSTNAAAPRLFGRFVDLAARPSPRNLLHLLFDPQGLQPFVHDWPQVACAMLQRVQREAVGNVVDDGTRQLLDALLAYPGVPADWRLRGAPAQSAAVPVIPIGFEVDGSVVEYFSMVATVGTPQSIAAQELRIESMFPANDETEAWHLAQMAG